MNTIASDVALRAPSAFRIYRLEAWFELLKLLRTPAFALPTLAFPLAFYVLFALVLPGQWGNLHKASYLFATYGVFGVIGPALFGFGVNIALDRENGLLELKRISPMPIGAYFVAKIAMSMAFGFAVLMLLSAAALGFGDVGMDVATWAKLVGVLLLGTLPFCALGLLIGTLVRGAAAVAIVNLIYLPMSVLSGLWMPLFAFPVVLQKAAVIWPAWHLGQMALGVVGQVEHVDYLFHAGVMVAMSALFLSMAALRLRAK